MHAGLLVPYWQQPGPLHRLPAGLKLALALTLILGLALQPRDAWRFFGVSAAVLLAAVVWARVPLDHLGRRLLLVWPFAAGVAVLALAQPGGGWIFLGLLVSSGLCLGVMVLLMATTRFTDLLGVLLRLRVPRLFVTTLALTYRYLFLLADETSRMSRARRSRTLAGGGWPVWRVRERSPAAMMVARRVSQGRRGWAGGFADCSRRRFTLA